MQSPIRLVRTYAGFVKLAHTVFALPFALAGMAAAYAVPVRFADAAPEYLPISLVTLVLILLCMVGARSFAMAMNRIIDRRIDALNPRTAGRELPAGRLTLRQAWVFAAASALLYFAACGLLGDVVLALSPVALVLMTGYPYMKRFTSWCHVVLGTALGLAPVGAWVAVRGTFEQLADKHRWHFFEPEGFRLFLFDSFIPGRVDSGGLGWLTVIELAPWLLGAAVALWVAGFDIIYALQDDEFDREHKLHSIPARFGRRGALWISRAMHALSAALFFAFVWAITREGAQLAVWIWAAPAIMLTGMFYQHTLVKPQDLSRVNMAFFTVNGVISVVFGAVFLAAWLLA